MYIKRNSYRKKYISRKRASKRTTYRRNRRYRKKSTQGFCRDTVQRVRTSHLAPFPKRTLIRQDLTVRVAIPTGSQRWNWTLIDANALNNIFSDLIATPWSASGQNLSPTNPRHPNGFTRYMGGTGYQKYQVHAAKITVTARPSDTRDNGRAFIMPVDSSAIAVYDGPPSSSDVSSVFNNYLCKSWDYSSGYTEKNNTRSVYVKTNNLEGLSPAEYNANQRYTGNPTVSPELYNSFLVGFQKDDGAAFVGGFAMTFDLSYWVEYFDLVMTGNDVEA